MAEEAGVRAEHERERLREERRARDRALDREREQGQASLREILAAGRRLADQRRTKGGHRCCRHSETR